LLDLLWIQAAIRVEQLRAKRRERYKIHCLIRVLDFFRIDDIVENGGETAQLLERGGIKFHVRISVAGLQGSPCAGQMRDRTCAIPRLGANLRHTGWPVRARTQDSSDGAKA
jgi:hypothetical protein